MEDEGFVTSITRGYIGEDGIARVVFLPNAVVTLEAAKEHFAACVESAQGRRVPVLGHVEGIKSVDREARQYFAGEEASRVTRASAILVGSPVARVVGSFFVGLNKPSFPVRLFTSESEAIEWLKGFLE